MSRYGYRFFTLAWPLVLATICCNVSRAAVPPTTYLIPATVEANGNDSNLDSHWDTIEPATVELLAYNGLPNAYNYRAALEFDLSAIPAGSSIQDAQFHIYYDGASGELSTPKLQFNSYAGNGAIDLSDFEQINQIGSLYPPFPPGSNLRFDVPITAQLQSLVENHQQFLGIMIQSVVWTQIAFKSSSGFPNQRPYISITAMPVPEPATLTNSFLLAAISVLRRPKRQRR